MANIGATIMNVSSSDGGEDYEHNDVGFVGIYKIFMVQDVIFFGTGQLAYSIKSRWRPGETRHLVRGW